MLVYVCAQIALGEVLVFRLFAQDAATDAGKAHILGVVKAVARAFPGKGELSGHRRCISLALPKSLPCPLWPLTLLHRLLPLVPLLTLVAARAPRPAPYHSQRWAPLPSHLDGRCWHGSRGRQEAQRALR
jgi:hypothetical protein